MDGVNPRFDFTTPAPELARLGRVHLIAIGGSGMSAVAHLLLDRGLAVSGSDARDSAVLGQLRRRGAIVWVGHDPAHVDGVDTVVISTAIRDDNPELAAARDRGLPVLHRAQALAATMAGKRVVAVSGASGKTTTTSMIAAALVASGADPSFASGTEITALGTNARIGAGPAFVVEADESDGSFLAYRPEIAVVTNVQPDHLDFFGSYAQVQRAYAAFADSLPTDGLLIACADDPGSAALAAEVARGGGRVRTYGVRPDADLHVAGTRAVGLGSISTVTLRGVEHELTLRVPGAHNVLDACAAFLAGTEGLDEDADAMLAGLAAYAGARRRFELRGERRGVSVVDDYAHNAAKVAAVVATAADLTHAHGGRLHVIFQPHLYSRTRDSADGFARGLAPADDVVLLDIYGAREEPMPGVSSELIATPLRRLPGIRVVEVGVPATEAARRVASRAAAGDLVVTVGAGDVTTVGPLVLQALETT